MPGHALTTALLLAALALAVAACGGDDETQQRKTFIVQADSICLGIESERLKIGERFTEASAGEPSERRTLRRLAPIYADGARLTESTLRKLEKLRPPESLEETWSLYQDAVKDRIKFARRAGAAKSLAELAELAKESDRNDEEARRLSDRIGFRECGDD